MNTRILMVMLSAMLVFVLQGNLLAQYEYADIINEFRSIEKKHHIHDPRAPLEEEDFEFVHFFDAADKYNVVADFMPNINIDTIKLGTFNGKVKEFLRAGYLKFKIEEQTFTLVAFQSLKSPKDAESFFIPYKDLTNGHLTYDGGRYMDILISNMKDNKLIVDFNKSYNPWCAYSDGFSCPIPPEENVMSIPVFAGEKSYTGPKKEGSKKPAEKK